MKYIYLTATFSFLLIGCNMNPSKEARIQKLEKEIAQSISKIDSLDQRIKMLEKVNK